MEARQKSKNVLVQEDVMRHGVFSRKLSCIQIRVKTERVCPVSSMFDFIGLTVSKQLAGIVSCISSVCSTLYSLCKILTHLFPRFPV